MTEKSPRCYIPSFTVTGHLVQERIFEDFYHILAIKHDGHLAHRPQPVQIAIPYSMEVPYEI